MKQLLYLEQCDFSHVVSIKACSSDYHYFT